MVYCDECNTKRSTTVNYFTSGPHYGTSRAVQKALKIRDEVISYYDRLNEIKDKELKKYEKRNSRRIICTES